MMEEFHVAYLVNYPWAHPEAGPVKLMSCRFVAMSKDDALTMAKEKIPQVIAKYDHDEGGVFITEGVVTVEVRSWAEWGNKLDANWDALCNATNTEEEEDQWRSQHQTP